MQCKSAPMLFARTRAAAAAVRGSLISSRAAIAADKVVKITGARSADKVMIRGEEMLVRSILASVLHAYVMILPRGKIRWVSSTECWAYPAYLNLRFPTLNHGDLTEFIQLWHGTHD